MCWNAKKGKKNEGLEESAAHNGPQFKKSESEEVTVSAESATHSQASRAMSEGMKQ